VRLLEPLTDREVQLGRDHPRPWLGDAYFFYFISNTIVKLSTHTYTYPTHTHTLSHTRTHTHTQSHTITRRHIHTYTHTHTITHTYRRARDTRVVLGVREPERCHLVRGR